MKDTDKIERYVRVPRLEKRRTTIQINISTHILVTAYARKHNLGMRDATERLISAGLALEEGVL